MASVTLETDTHKHKGVICQKGQTLNVDLPTAQFLLRAGVIKKIPVSKTDLNKGATK